MSSLALSDKIVFVLYFLMVASYGYWVYRKKKDTVSASQDFFLAEGSLTWWAIGASLIASNISAEQFIGMSGEGFFVGVAIAAYEWIAALGLIIIAVWFIPIYLKNKIYTMPQFLKTRYNESVALVMAIFWLLLYVFVNFTSILYLGAVAINGLLGGDYLHLVMIGLMLMALIITLGGMKVIGYTDVIQVAVLIIGGFATVYMALQIVDQRINHVIDGSALAGFNTLLSQAPEHFHLILPKPNNTDMSAAGQLARDKYIILPGIAMYFAGQWILNINYWGCNQYITQRALGADLPTARKGILFAALLKLLMPVIVMLPGIAAYVLHKNGHLNHLVGLTRLITIYLYIKQIMDMKGLLDDYLKKDTRITKRDSGNGYQEVCDLDTGDCYTIRMKDGLIERVDNTMKTFRKIQVETNQGIKTLLNG